VASAQASKAPEKTITADLPVVPVFGLVRQGGYWCPLYLKIQGNTIVEKEIGNGDAAAIAMIKGELWLSKLLGL
jgi:hypothetical protein